MFIAPILRLETDCQSDGGGDCGGGGDGGGVVVAEMQNCHKSSLTINLKIQNSSVTLLRTASIMFRTK
jgi:hypothetical protein